jgi:hypothetical protein
LDNFKIQLLTQNWIDDKPDDGMDFCSHGKVLLMVNNLVLSGENSGDWTVASSALRLMKSAIYGYDSKNELEVIPCCGYLRLFPSCPNYITWDTEINGDIIVVSNIQTSRNEENGLKIINGSFKIYYKEYLIQVLNFADKVKEFYSSHMPRKFYDKFDEEEYELFWKEFNEYFHTLNEKCAK